MIVTFNVDLKITYITLNSMINVINILIAKSAQKCHMILGKHPLTIFIYI